MGKDDKTFLRVHSFVKDGKEKAYVFAFLGEEDAIGAVRTLSGKTVLFLAVSSGDAATRKEMLGIIHSARFGPG